MFPLHVPSTPLLIVKPILYSGEKGVEGIQNAPEVLREHPGEPQVPDHRCLRRLSPRRGSTSLLSSHVSMLTERPTL